MRDHYDLDKMKWRRNPFAKMFKRSITIRLDLETIAYFKTMAEQTGLGYQNLINLYLRDCAVHKRQLAIVWRAAKFLSPKKKLSSDSPKEP